jgi:hypothetical protein
MSKTIEQLLEDRCNGIIDNEYEESFDVTDFDTLNDTLNDTLDDTLENILIEDISKQIDLIENNTVKTTVENYSIQYDILLPHISNKYHSAIAGLIYGCALGDNLGLQLEGKTLDEIKHPITGQPTKDFKGIEKDDWTDDTDQLVLLMESIGETKGQTIQISHFIKSLINWKKNGFRELDDCTGKSIEPFTSHVINMPNYTKDPIQSALSAYKTLGNDVCTNGSLMRVGIVATCKDWQTSAVKQSLITHVDCRCLYASWLHVAICRALLKGFIPDISELLSNRMYFMKNKTNKEEFNKYAEIYLLPRKAMLNKLQLDVSPISYVLKTIGVSFYALACIRDGVVNNCVDVKRELLTIVNYAGDADTNAAVAGQIFGAYVTYSNLPMDWIKTLKHKQWLDRKIIAFLKILV